VVDRSAGTGLLGAVSAAVKVLFGLDPVADDLAPAVSTDRGKLVDRALETIKHVTVARRHYLK
jgi:hypothetical protein